MAGNKQLVNLTALEALAEDLKKRLEKIESKPTVSGSVYKPAGNLDNPDSSKLSEENVGKVYNIQQEFTTDSNFVDPSEKKFPAGTDIAVVEVDSGSYKFNVLSGFVDLEPYAKTEDVQGAIDSALENAIVDPEEVTSMLKEVFGED